MRLSDAFGKLATAQALFLCTCVLAKLALNFWKLLFLKSTSPTTKGKPMPKTISVSVADKTYDLTQHLCNYVKALKTALADGWQPGADIPAILQATLTEGYA